WPNACEQNSNATNLHSSVHSHRSPNGSSRKSNRGSAKTDIPWRIPNTFTRKRKQTYPLVQFWWSIEPPTCQARLFPWNATSPTFIRPTGCLYQGNGRVGRVRS